MNKPTFQDLIKHLIGQNLKSSFQCRFLRNGCLSLKIPNFRTPVLVDVRKENGEKIITVSQGNFKAEYLSRNGLPIFYNSIKVSWFQKTFWNENGTWYTDTKALEVVNRLLNSWAEQLTSELNQKKANIA